MVGVGSGAGVVGVGSGAGVVGVGSGAGVVGVGSGAGVVGVGFGSTEPSPSVPPFDFTEAVASSFMPLISAWLVTLFWPSGTFICSGG